MSTAGDRASHGGPSDADDLELLRRFEPVVRFNEGEYFLPASVESYVRVAELWERTGPSDKRLVAPAGTIDLDRLVELTDAQRGTPLISGWSTAG